MDGVHDLGGKQGFGRIPYAPHAQSFHAAWEKRAYVMFGTAVRLGIINMDEYRHAIERMEPRHYLAASYYERSLTGLATLCVEKGLATHAELEADAGGRFPLSRHSTPGRTNAPDRQRFQRGEKVRVKDEHFAGHTRMPSYIRGKVGVVVSESPLTPFPDAHAHGVEAEDEPTYDIRFRSEDLWPNGADSALVHVSVFQSYLERVD